MNAARLFAAAYCAWIGVLLALDVRDHVEYARAGVGRGRPPRLLDALSLPRIGPGGLLRLGYSLSAVLLAVPVASGPSLRLLLGTAAVLAILYFAQVLDHPALRRKIGLTPPIFITLALTPGIDRPYGELETAHWLLPIQALVAQAYFSSGVQKLRHAGWAWADGTSLRVRLVEHYLWGGFREALALARFPRICRLLSTATLVLELTFPLALAGPLLAAPYLAGGLAFHASSRRVMGIRFLRYFCPAYLAFVPALLERSWSC